MTESSLIYTLVFTLPCYCYSTPCFVSSKGSGVALCTDVWRAQTCSNSRLKLPQLQQKLLDWTNWVSWCSVRGAVGQICSLCLCSANSFLLAQAEPQALWGLMGKGRGERNSDLPRTGHLELALRGSSWWCCLWKDGLDYELPPLQLPVMLQFCTRISCLGIRVSIK